MKRCLQILLLSLLAMNVAAKLAVTVDQPKQISGKTVIRITVKNTFTNKVESARATVFLLNDQEKIIGQSTQWVIGGVKEQPPLLPHKTTTYNFVIKTDKPFTKTKLIFNRIILEGGRQVDPKTAAEISN